MVTKRKIHKGQQDGAVIIEASIVLPLFMFAIYTLLSVVQMAYTQARIAVALDSATKQVAEYMHVYYVMEMDKVLTGQGGKSSQLANNVADFLQTLGEGLGNIDTELGQFVDDAGNALKGDSLTALVQNKTGSLLVEQMMKNNLKTGSQSADDFLKKNRVENLNMEGSKFLEAGEGSTGTDIFMRVNYDIKVIQLFKIDVVFHVSHCAYAQAWKGD